MLKNTLLFMVLVLVVGCSSDFGEREDTAASSQELGTYTSWASVDGTQSTATRGVAVFQTSAAYLRTVHMLNVTSSGVLRWQVLDQEGDDQLSGYGWADVPNQDSGTEILSTSVPTVIRDSSWDWYVFTVNVDNEVQYVKYDLSNMGDQTGTWGTWTSLSSLGDFTNVTVFTDPWPENAFMLLTRESDSKPMYAMSNEDPIDLTDWDGPWVMDDEPTGSTDLQMTGAIWNDGVHAFIGNSTSRKYYTSSYDTSCGTPGAGCWDGWTQLTDISHTGYGAKMLTAKAVWDPMDMFDQQICLYAAHRFKGKLFNSILQPWNVYESCTSTGDFSAFSSLGTYSTSTDFATEAVPVAYSDQVSGLTPATRYIYEADAWRGTGKVYSVKLGEVTP